ncbi:hypothetical protein P43SY_004131 [Pythium insidiosum]|uniref:Uncharacterized protein n=1 Tax=Pythium insidiosum TaxID=114742 RepID=A0AAD5LZC5_PYTIN|nr:hypothetical protein P43SY_004131 [Pythium insidiosum]
MKGASDIKNKLEELTAITKDLLNEMWTFVTYRGLKSLFGFLVNIFTFDLGGIASSTKEGLQMFAQRDYLRGNQLRVENMGKKIKTTVEMMTRFSDQISSVSSFDMATWEDLAKLIEGGVNDQNLNTLAKKFDTFKVELRAAEIGDITANLQQVLDVSCEALADVDATKWANTATKSAEALRKCRTIATTVGVLQDKMSEAFQVLDTLRELVSDYLARKAECSQAKSAQAWAQNGKRRLRQDRTLQQIDVAANEPFFAMAYMGLTKIILDYQLQEAAHQFCKFHEYKDGGVAPPMCRSKTASRTYYTLAQIEQMRYNTVGLRAFLPTQPAYSETHNKSYPYLDLARLRNGDALSVSLPTWDPAWLKQHGWISPSMPVDQTPTMYISSIRIHMPVVTNDSVGDHSSSSLAVTVHVTSTREQYLGLARRDKLFVLPTQRFTYGAVYGESVCSPTSSTMNVFHSIAGCVRDDGTSDVCVRETGSTQVLTTEQLLPSLFSTWRVQAEISKPNGDAMDLFIRETPLRATNRTAVNLLVPVDLSVIQVSSTATPESLPAPPEAPEAVQPGSTTCCAADEFRISRNTCQKCPAGTAPVLRGYACVAQF